MLGIDFSDEFSMVNKTNSLGSGAREPSLKHIPAMTLDMSVSFLILIFSHEKYINTCFMGLIWGFNHSAWHLISYNLVLAIRASIKDSLQKSFMCWYGNPLIPNKFRNQI